MKSENKVQNECFVWFTNNFCLKNHSPKCVFFSIPNGGTRNIREAVTLKQTGLRKGASDFVVLMNNRAIFFEAKTEIGKQSQDQKEFEIDVGNLGFEYYLIRSLEQFKSIILKAIK